VKPAATALLDKEFAAWRNRPLQLFVGRRAIV
jgi:hypothetical protein